jgi:putative ABC transport system ATP-binding protein
VSLSIATWARPAFGRAQPAVAITGGTPDPERPPIVRLRSITRTYDMGHVTVPALRSVDLDVEPGEFVAIVGPSGSGKSTMMNIIGCLDRPTEGTYTLAGTPVEELDDDDLARVRSRTIGFVFQSYNLLPRTSALDNVATPLLYQGVGRSERHRRATAALERLGLGDRLDHEPSELSGGQQQRVAVARALVTDPALILADEPTGNLDQASGQDVLRVLRELHESGRTIVLITHDAEVADAASRQVHIRDGRLLA